MQHRKLFSERLIQRLEEAGIFRLGADGHAQPFGQAIAADRADDDALLEEFQVDRRAIASPEGDEVAMRRDVFEAKALQPGDDLFHTAPVEFVAFGDE